MHRARVQKDTRTDIKSLVYYMVEHGYLCEWDSYSVLGTFYCIDTTFIYNVVISCNHTYCRGVGT